MIKSDDFSSGDSGVHEQEVDHARTTYRADLAAGVISVLLGAAVITYALSLPTLGDGKPGPGLFPGIVGGAFILFGLVLAGQSWAATRRRTPIRPYGAGDDTRDLIGEEADHPASIKTLDVPVKRLVANAAVIILAIILYILLADFLGFLITMCLVTSAVMLSLRSKPLTTAITAVVLSLLMWFVFEELLMVQLPDGLLV